MKQLFTAIEKKDNTTVRELLNQGIDPNVRGSLSRTPLIHAVLNQNKEAVDLLLTYPIDIEAKTKHGDTALQFSIINDEDSTFLETLLKAGANINHQGSNDQTILICLAKYKSESSNKMLEFCIQHHAKIDLTDSNGFTALLHAAQNNATKNIESLIRAGANINHADARGNSALIHSLYNDTFEQLLNYGANVNQQNIQGWTVLMNAILTSDAPHKVNAVHALLKLPDIDLSLKSNDGRTAYDIAIAAKKFDIAAKIQEAESRQVCDKLNSTISDNHQVGTLAF